METGVGGYLFYLLSSHN